MNTIEELIERTQYFVCCDGDFYPECIKFTLLNAKKVSNFIHGYDFAGRPTVLWVKNVTEDEWNVNPL